MSTKVQAIMDAGTKLAIRDGFINLTMTSVCDEAKVSYGAFSFHMGMGFTEFLEQLKLTLPHNALTHPLTRSRATKEARKESILGHALELAIQQGYRNVSPSELAEVAGVTRQSVFHYVGTKPQLQKAILRLATVTKNIPILAQAISDPDAKLAPELRHEVLQYLIQKA